MLFMIGKPILPVWGSPNKIAYFQHYVDLTFDPTKSTRVLATNQSERTTHEDFFANAQVIVISRKTRRIKVVNNMYLLKFILPAT